MIYSVLLTEQAKSDLIAIYKYIANDLLSPEAAQGQLTRIEKAIESLNQMPERFRKYEHEKWQKRNLRIMKVNNYLVFYISSKDDGKVTVIRIMYGKRDIDKQLNNE